MTSISASFDPSDFLDSEELIAGYLTAAADDPDPDVFVAALNDVEKAREAGLLRFARKDE
jgi:DNA-binding phage protein